jgi:hypothetical protein
MIGLLFGHFWKLWGKDAPFLYFLLIEWREFSSAESCTNRVKATDVVNVVVLAKIRERDELKMKDSPPPSQSQTKTTKRKPTKIPITVDTTINQSINIILEYFIKIEKEDQN